MERRILRQIGNQLAKITRPCEVGLYVAVVGLPGSKAGLLPDRLHAFIDSLPPKGDLPFDEKIPLIPYFKEGRVQLNHYTLRPDEDLDMRVFSLLRSCDGIILQLDKIDPSLMPAAKRILDRVLKIVLDKRRVAVFASTRTFASKLEKSRLVTGLDLLHTKIPELDSLHVFGPYEKEQKGYPSLLGWIGDLLEQKQFIHSCVVESVYVYDEAGLPVLLLETSSSNPSLDPTLLTGMYRALEVLFFKQKGAVIKSLSLEGEEEEDLTLAAVRHKDLAALLFLRGPCSKTLIWKIGTYLLIGVKDVLPKMIPGATMMRTIPADSLLAPLQPHRCGECDKCHSLHHP